MPRTQSTTKADLAFLRAAGSFLCGVLKTKYSITVPDDMMFSKANLSLVSRHRCAKSVECSPWGNRSAVAVRKYLGSFNKGCMFNCLKMCTVELRCLTRTKLLN